MVPLARRNLFHDRIRLAVTLAGVVFAVVLVAIQLGLFVGFSRATTGLIDHAGADLWMMSPRVRYIEMGSRFSERKLYQALAVPGVVAADRYLLQFLPWRRADGEETSVMLIGFNPASGLGGPWNIVGGRLEDVNQADAVIVDRLYAKKLGVSKIGDGVEIKGRRARVVGFTDGIRSFTTSPIVFTSYHNALLYSQVPENETLFALIKTDPKADPLAVKDAVRERLPDMDVRTADEFSHMTRRYWMFTTGAGATVIFAACLGLLVGSVIVAQTIYAATMDHLKEFGTLKAMGASNRVLYRVILEQAAWSAVIGYGLGMSVAVALAVWSRHAAMQLFVTPGLAGLLLGITLAMCLGASMLSIQKVTRLEPAMVFK